MLVLASKPLGLVMTLNVMRVRSMERRKSEVDREPCMERGMVLVVKAGHHHLHRPRVVAAQEIKPTSHLALHRVMLRSRWTVCRQPWMAQILPPLWVRRIEGWLPLACAPRSCMHMLC